jgi:hypothetical protein
MDSVITITHTNSVDHKHHSTGTTTGLKVKMFGDQTDVPFLVYMK